MVRKVYLIGSVLSADELRAFIKYWMTVGTILLTAILIWGVAQLFK
jgi:hypothetical protein